MSAAGRAGFRLLRLDVAPALELSLPSALSAVAELLVPGGGPLFAGHFPGRPLLPGIAHLALLCLVLEALAARGILGGEAPGNTAIAEVRRFRLRREIVPGDRIELRVQGIGAARTMGAAGTAGEAGAMAAAGEAEATRPADASGTVGEAATAREAGAFRSNATAGATGVAGAAAGTAAVGAESGVFRFELRRRPAASQPGHPGEIASEGTVRTGIGCVRPPAAAPIHQPDAALGGPFRPVADLVPHAPPARLLAEVLAAGAGGILCAGNIPAGHPLATGGEAPGFLAIELGAQAAAAHEALAGHPRCSPRIGYLVGVRDAHLPARLPTGRTLRVTAVPAGAAAALAIYDMEVAQEGAAEPLAAGRISTFLAES